MALKIRKIQKRDWKAVKNIYNEWRTEGTFAVPDYLFSDKKIKKHITILLKRGVNLIAELDGKVIGILECEQGGLSKTAHTLNIQQLNILAAYRKFGIASALFKKIFDISHSKRINVLFLHVAANNNPAIASYKKFGFVKTGYIKNQFRFGNKFINNNIMCKILK